VIYPVAPNHVMRFELAGKGPFGQRERVACSCGWVSEPRDRKEEAEDLAQFHAMTSAPPACPTCQGTGHVLEVASGICPICDGRGRLVP
jgi:RecJ-like exonuclease